MAANALSILAAGWVAVPLWQAVAMGAIGAAGYVFGLWAREWFLRLRRRKRSVSPREAPVVPPKQSNVP